MRKQSFVIMAILLAVAIVLFVLVDFLSNMKSLQAASAADVTPPTVIAVDPASVFNDLDASIVITGTDFMVELSGTQILASPSAYLGNEALKDVTWVDSTTLNATVPWGLDSSVYTLTVVNPDGGTGSLTNAFTVTQGIGEWNGGDLFGGAVTQILMKPGDANTLYALAPSAGFFRSRDAGENWDFVSSFWGGIYAIDPLHPSWLYVLGQGGLFRSQDEGDNWTNLELNSWPDGRAYSYAQEYVSPHESQVLFFSSCDKEDENYPPSNAWGLIKSTDGGASWQIVADMEGIPVVDVDFHPTDALQMVLATQDGQVFQSTDAGDHWSAVTKPPMSSIGLEGVITYNPYKPAEVWIASDVPAGVYTSTAEAFTTWYDVTPPDGSGSWVVKFTSPDSVYITGDHSDDGGKTWQPFGLLTTSGEMSFNPDNPQIGYIGDDFYGVQKTTDGGLNWEIKNQGLTGMVSSFMDVSRFDPLRVYTMFSWPGVFRSEDGANSWNYFSLTGSYHVYQVREDPFDPQRIYAAADSFYVSEDGGKSWSDLGWNASPSWPGGIIYAMQPDPYQAGHLLLGLDTFPIAPGAGRLYASSDYGASWQQVSMPQDLDWIRSIAFDPETPGLVYLTAGGIYRSIDSGVSWERIDDQQQSMQPAMSFTIATHPEHILFVQVGDNPPCRSMDGGATWECLPSSPRGTFMFMGGDSTRLYEASYFGLSLSTDAGDSWTQAAGALGSLNITALGYAVGEDYTILYAATSGGYTGAKGSMLVEPPQASLATQGDLVEAGIYRYVQHIWQTFLPVVQRGP